MCQIVSDMERYDTVAATIASDSSCLSLTLQQLLLIFLPQVEQEEGSNFLNIMFCEQKLPSF